jgi:hypothetical protein
MFPLAFPFDLLQAGPTNAWVLDPFCGRGTTIYAARLRGMPSVGIDSNPVAAAISGAKLVYVRPAEVVRLAKSILHERQGLDPCLPPSDEFWDRCFADGTLRQICRLRTYLLLSCKTRLEIALRALLLGILHGPRNKGPATYLSNQMPRTYSTKPDPAVRFWKKKRMKPPDVDVLEAIQRRARFSFNEVPATRPGYVVCADARSFDLSQLDVRFSWVVTSPPYYGMRTYFPDHWLRNWFLGGPSTVDYQADEQLSHKSEIEFVADLSEVWKAVAVACKPGARLICRFGALPSRAKDPRQLFKTTLSNANCGWRITTIRGAGTSQLGRRQYDQFATGISAPIPEIDVFARLER